MASNVHLGSAVLVCAQVYLSGQASDEARTSAEATFACHCAGLDAASRWEDAAAVAPEFDTRLALVRPAAWPLPVLAAHFAGASTTTTVIHDAALVEFSALQLLALSVGTYAAPQDAAATARTADSTTAAQLLDGVARASNPLLASSLPAPLLRMFLQPGSNESVQHGSWDQGWLYKSSSTAGYEAQLRRLWWAVLCYAERATPTDLQLRTDWPARFHTDLQVWLANTERQVQPS